MLGNECLIEQIARQAQAGSLSHAYLITGEKGMGKKELAKIFSLEVFCKEKSNGRACGVCPDCKKVLSGNHPDLIRLNHGKPNMISVNEVREQLSDTVGIRPYEGGKKIYIVDEAQKMTVQAQNALLKTLEEPPEYVTVLLLCDDDRTLLDTVRSRCVMMRPERIPTEEIRKQLETRGTDPDSAQVCAAFARGNPGRAADLAEGEVFRGAYRTVVGLCRNIRSMDAAQISRTARDLCAGEEDPELILELIENWYRDLLCCRMTRSAEGITFQGEQSAIKTMSNSIRPETAAQIMKAAEETASRLKANVNRELSLTVLFLKMRELT